MLEIISIVIIFADLVLAILAMKAYISRTKRTDIMYPKGLFWLVECGTVIFALGYLWLLREMNQYNCIGLLLTVTGGLALLEWLRYGILFDETGFWVRNIFGKKIRYEYKDILKVSHKKTEHNGRPVSYTLRTTTLHFADKKVSIDRGCENYFEFLEKKARCEKKEKIKDRKEALENPNGKKKSKKKKKKNG